MKVTFTMGDPVGKKHSVQFDFEELERIDDANFDPTAAEQDVPQAVKAVTASLKRASFYIPKPLAERAKRIRVTIEEL